MHTRVVQGEQRMGGAEDRLLLVDVDRREAGPPGAQRRYERAGLDQLGPAGVDEERVGLHAGEVGRRDDAARLRAQPQVEGEHVGPLAELALAGGRGVAVGPGAGERALPSPDQHVHPERPPVARHQACRSCRTPRCRASARAGPCPSSLCHCPARSRATSCGMWRRAASTSAQVSSAGA